MILLSVVLLSAGCAFATSEDNVALSNEEVISGDVIAIEPNDSVLSEGESTNTQAIVTKDTFHNYFSDDGTLLDSVSSDELKFEGDFTGLDVSYITIGKTIKLSGNNVALNGVSFIIGADNVVIDGFKLTHSDAYLFYVDSLKGVTISNNVINYSALEGCDSYAIYANAVSDLKIVNNTIKYVGNTDGTVVNNVICVTGDEDSEISSKNTVVEGNVFDIEIPSVAVGYDPITWSSKVYSEGIAFYYCDGIKFNNNRVSLKYNKVSGYYDTLYAVSVRGNPFNFDAEEAIVCSDVEIINNTINVAGHTYIYAVLLSAENFKISNNVINASADANYANAISIEGPSSNGVVSNNVMNVKAPLNTYGVYSYQWNGAIDDASYVNNTIVCDSEVACAMEIVENNPTIENNTLIVKGNYTSGIVSNMVKKGHVSGNVISTLGSNIGDITMGDTLLPKNSLGMSIKGSALIENNIVNSTGIGINLVEGSNDICIKNNNIFVSNVGDVESYAILSNGVNKLTILDNSVVFIGNTSGSAINNAIRISGGDDTSAKNIVVKNNDVDISIPSVDVNYDPVTYAPTVIAEGVAFYCCDNVTFVDNRVSLKYNKASGNYDTIYVVSVRSDSKNVVISNNNISAMGHNYVYGVLVIADNFTVADNIIDIKSDAYYAAGINVESFSANGIIKNNQIDVTAVGMVYGIYSSNYPAPCENIIYDNNNINVNAYGACGMELMDANPYISNNKITAIGNYTYGLVLSISNNGTVVSNVIVAKGSEIGDAATGDYLLPKKSLAIYVSGNALIKNNDVTTSGVGVNTLTGNIEIIDNVIAAGGDYAVVSNGGNLIVKQNYLVSKKSVGSNAIVSDKQFVASDNTPSLKIVIFAPDLTAKYNANGILFPVMVYDENGDAVADIAVNLKVDGVVYNATTDSKGRANFVVKLNAGSYDALVSYEGNDVYGPKSVATNINVDKLESQIVAKSSTTVYLTYVKSGYYHNIVLKDANGKVLADKKVTITFNGKSKTYTTDSEGLIKYKVSASKVGNYELKISYAGDSNYVDSSATSKLVIVKQPTKLTASKKTFSIKTKVKSFSVVLKDNKNKAIKKVKVTIKVNGKTYSAVTNSNGKATFKITKLVKRGTFTATVKFAGNGYYTASSKAVKITVR